MAQRYVFKRWVVFPIFWSLLVALDFVSFKANLSILGAYVGWYRSAQIWLFDRTSWRVEAQIRKGIAAGSVSLAELFGPDGVAVCPMFPYGDLNELLVNKGLLETFPPGEIPESVAEDQWALVVMYSGDQEFEVLNFFQNRIYLEGPIDCYEVSADVYFVTVQDKNPRYYDLSVRFAGDPLP